jgi:two-component system alkaline phosphatase synthesis response regulator PhoP
MTARILIIEDEAPLRMALADALVAEGYEVLEAGDGEAGLQLALTEDPAAILLDLMLPGRDGFSVLRALREDRLFAPVLILSARGEEWDRIQGFEYGADDYLVKPFSTRELLARLKAALIRAGGAAPGMNETAAHARFGAVEVDFGAYTLTHAGVRHGLSRRELELLRYFLDHEGVALERLTILTEVWGSDESPTTRTIDTHVLKLRKKLEPDPENPVFLVTVHGVGYRFVRRPSTPQ